MIHIMNGHTCWFIDLLSGLWWGDGRTECCSGICQEPLRQHVPSMGIFLSLIWFWKVYSWISNVDLFFHFYSHPNFWIWWCWTIWHIFLVSSRGLWIKAEGQYRKRDLCTLSVPLLKFIDKVINQWLISALCMHVKLNWSSFWVSKFLCGFWCFVSLYWLICHNSQLSICWKICQIDVMM